MNKLNLKKEWKMFFFCSDYRNESNEMLVLGEGFFFRKIAIFK